MKINRCFIATLFIVFFISGCSSLDKNEEYIKIPDQNIVNIKRIWKDNLKFQQSEFDIENQLIYVVTWGNWIYIIDKNDGLIKKKISLEGIERNYCNGVAVENGIIAINYSNRIVVYDTVNEKLINDFVITEDSIVALEYYVLLKDQILIYSNTVDKKIYAVNYWNGEVVWTYGGNFEEHGALRLRKYNEEYLFTKGSEYSFYKFEPSTGEIIDKVDFVSKGEIRNEYHSFFIPEALNIVDIKYKNWLENRVFGLFKITEKGYIYSSFGEKFYFYGDDATLDWELTLPKEIYVTVEYGRYTILDLRDTIAILDLETKEIIWSRNIKVASKAGSFIKDDIFYLVGEEGEYEAYDLSVLKEKD